MKERNGGFTLIELLIALAVLSIMSGVLLQSFVVSRRLNTKAAGEETVLNAAKRTMEELKAFPLDELEKYIADDDRGYESGREDLDFGEPSGISGRVRIGNTIYRVERLENDTLESEATDKTGRGYRLITEYGRSPSGDGKAKYIICADADFQIYNQAEEDSGNSYSVNQYKMPNIADVSSFQNAVIDPQTLIKDDALLTARLLLKVNPDGEGEEESGGTEEGITEEIYDETDVSRRLMIQVDETSADDGDRKGVLNVLARAVYTVDPSGAEHPDDELTIEANLALIKRNVVKQEGKTRPANRVYLFLPDESTSYTWTTKEEDGEHTTEISGFPGFEHIRISYRLEESIEFFLVAASPEQYEDIVRNSVVSMEPAGNTELLIYSNMGESEPVSYKDEENRLYHLTVRVYEADYKTSDAGDGEPSMGRELLRVDSSKSE